LWYERKQPSPDKLGAILITIVAIPSVTTESAAVSIAVHCTSFAIGPDDAAVVACVSVPIVSIRGVGGGACSDTPFIHVSVIVSAAIKATGLRSITRCLHKAAGTSQALAIVARLRWKRRDNFRVHVPRRSKSVGVIFTFLQKQKTVWHQAREQINLSWCSSTCPFALDEKTAPFSGDKCFPHS